MKQNGKRVGVTAALLALTMLASAPALAKNREGREAEEISRPLGGPPVMAVVSLSEQRVTIYDADGKILRAPVSTGQTGYETPAGIYSVIQKDAEHYSNLYDDASMPFMQRITWSGIALHAGALPGHPASHGCIRMPTGFAEQLFDMHQAGHARRHRARRHAPHFFRPSCTVQTGSHRLGRRHAGRDLLDYARADRHAFGCGGGRWHPGQAANVAIDCRRQKGRGRRRRQNGGRRAPHRRQRQRGGGKIAKALRIAEVAKRKAEDQLQDIESALSSDPERLSDERKAKLDEAKEKAQAKLQEAQARLEAAQLDGNAKMLAANTAKDAVKAALDVKDAAAKEARLAQNKMAPVSVFISRKTQRLYVRQGFQPMFESEVTIRDPQAAIGSFVFSALDYTSDDGTDLRWTALAMYPNPTDPGTPPSRHGGRRGGEPRATDARAAKIALERISIPQDTIDRIREVASPGSAVIVSDEALSNETGKGTDFVVLMSGELQGGIKIRKRNNDAPSAWRRDRDPYGDYGYRRPYYQRSSPYYSGGSGPFGWW